MKLREFSLFSGAVVVTFVELRIAARTAAQAESGGDVDARVVLTGIVSAGILVLQ